MGSRRKICDPKRDTSMPILRAAGLGWRDSLSNPGDRVRARRLLLGSRTMVECGGRKRMGERVDGVLGRLTAVERKVDSLDFKVSSVEVKVDALDMRVGSVEAKVDALEVKVDSVDGKVDSLAATMDRRFDEVAVALVEQRRYTDFAYEGLDERMSALETEVRSGFARMDRKLDQLIDRA
jgi:hypothetical protein